MKKNQQLWYNQPADVGIWEEALPLGNGSLGAMVFGGVGEALLQLNQESVWYGGVRNRVNPDSKKVLGMVRDLLFEGKLSAAETLAYTGMFGTPMSQGHYEPLCDLKVIFNQKIPHHSELGQECQKQYTSYQRRLDLTTATHKVTYALEGVHYIRETFISYPDQMLVMSITTKESAQFDLRVELSRSDNYEVVKTMGEDSIVLKGSSGGAGAEFVALTKVMTPDGEIQPIGANICVKGATKVLIVLTAKTSFECDDPFKWCQQVMDKGSESTYETLYKRHLKDYQSLYSRVGLALSQGDGLETLTTKQRLSRLKEGGKDEGLFALYFQYGRYLLLASSRPGSLPANLQGIWNKEMQPPWGSKYTININTEMNYWHAETTNLSECHEPLFEHLKRMLPKGQAVAGQMYGCRGFMAHHNTDIFGDCAPQDQWMPATIWPMGAAWLSTHLIEHYLFTKDLEFAKDYYNIIYEAALFFVDFLIEDKQGHLVTSPSTSPENTYLLPNGEKSALCYGPSMDSQIIRALWEGTIMLAKELKKVNPMVEQMQGLLERLPKTTIGSRGQILEWTKEYKEWEVGHRHISHLYALYPGHTITAQDTDLFEGAKKTLIERLSGGGGHTGWSRAWIINMWARLLDGEEAYQNINALLKQSTADNLFDMHPPFQIDGNFGGTAGIAEMLLQSHEGFIRILPALPSAWANGHVFGLKARNNIEVSIRWENHQLIEATFKSIESMVVTIEYKGRYFVEALGKNDVYCIRL